MPSKAVFITYKTKAGADKALEYDGDQYGKGTLQAVGIQITHLSYETFHDILHLSNDLTCEQ